MIEIGEIWFLIQIEFNWNDRFPKSSAKKKKIIISRVFIFKKLYVLCAMNRFWIGNPDESFYNPNPRLFEAFDIQHFAWLQPLIQFKLFKYRKSDLNWLTAMNEKNKEKKNQCENGKNSVLDVCHHGIQWSMQDTEGSSLFLIFFVVRFTIWCQRKIVHTV